MYHSAIPIDGVAAKDTKLFYKRVGQFLLSDSYQDMVAKVFDKSVQDVSGREYRTGFLLAAFLRGKTVEMCALAKLTELQSDADKSVGQTYSLMEEEAQ